MSPNSLAWMVTESYQARNRRKAVEGIWRLPYIQEDRSVRHHAVHRCERHSRARAVDQRLGWGFLQVLRIQLVICQIQPQTSPCGKAPGANFQLLPMLWLTEYQEVCPTPHHLQVSVQAHEQAQGNREQALGNRLCTAAKVKPETRLFSEIQDTPVPLCCLGITLQGPKLLTKP